MITAPARPALPPPAAAPGASVQRLYFLDNLRVALVMLVIAHHVGQAYGPTGGFWPIQQTARAALLGPFFTVNRSFFMSLLFMISGYFTVMSFEAHGAKGFLKNRWRRLGVPLLGWCLLVAILQVLATRSLARPIEVGHLWFIEHLLIFSLVYALWRTLRPGRTGRLPRNPPGPLAILGLALTIAILSAVIRLWYPIDRWVTLFGFVKVMWADVPRDLAFFIVGLLAYRNNWLANFPTRAGMAWLAVGVSAAAFWYAHDLGLTGNLLPRTGPAAGVLFLLWESLLCCALCIGLTIFFREKLNMTGPWSTALSQAQYAAYIFHLPIVLLCQYAALRLPLPPLPKFALVTLAAIPLSFCFASCIRKPLRL